MGTESKLISGLLCHIGKTLREKNVCKKCPYRKDVAEKCHGKLAFDALSYIFANEYGKHLLDGMGNISEVTRGCRPPDRVLEDIRSGNGLEPIKRPPPLR